MNYIKLGIELLQASGLVTKLILASGLLIAGVTAYGVWHHKVYRAGYDRARYEIAIEDQKALDGALALRKTLAGCRARGGRWIQSEGRCS